MKNNKGFGKFEVLTMIVVLLGIFAYFGYTLMKPQMEKKLSAMLKNATTFARVVIQNYDSFHNDRTVFLGEVIDEELMEKVPNPFGEGNCSLSESRVDYEEGEYYVTFQCGEFLLDHVPVSSTEEVNYYEVGEWKEKKTSDKDEEKALFNCLVDGKEKYPEYYDELYFVSRINHDFEKDHYLAITIKDECEVVAKTFYRTKEKYQAKKKK